VIDRVGNPLVAPSTVPSETAGNRQRCSGRRMGRMALLVLASVMGTLLLLGYLGASLSMLETRVKWQITSTGHPFVISDLFPRWYGARALLRGEDPYSASFTADLQRAYYGRTMAPEQERDLFGTIVEFFYPPYVLLPLLPFLWLPFEPVRWLAGALLATCVVTSSLLWWHLSGGSQRGMALLAVGGGALLCYPTLDLISLQQLTGLVLLYLTGAIVLASRGHHGWAGVLLALAMIKPQAAALPAAWLLLWALSRRERWRLLAAFLTAMGVQLAFAEALVPGWLGAFLAASARYQRYNEIGYWLPAFVTGGEVPAGALLVGLPVVIALGCLWWRNRHEALTAPAVLGTSASTMAAVFVLMPDIITYNKTFLLLALSTLAAWGKGRARWQRVVWTTVWGLVLLPYPAVALSAWYLLYRHLASEAYATRASSSLASLSGAYGGVPAVLLILSPLVVTGAMLVFTFRAADLGRGP
jgi:hypothetical protein